jgi:phenylalanyl-tRNA synthetase beta chain
MAGPREPGYWENADSTPMDFYDMKGVVSGFVEGLNLSGVAYEPSQHPAFHPGKCARITLGDTQLGVFGELHPQVLNQYTLGDHPVLAATFNLDAIYAAVPEGFDSAGVPAYPPVLEDLAFVVSEELPAAQVEAMIRQTGGNLLADLTLFDVFRGGQIGAGKKSLAYKLTYQHPERTLTDDEVAKLRSRIAKRLEQELGAQLRA